MDEQDVGLDVMVKGLLRMVIKRRWWLLVPAVVLGLGACAVSTVIPNHYQSEATILVEHQQVPERYVTPNSTADIREALLIMTDAILSRTQLLQIINEFGLYSDRRKQMDSEELVDIMRANVTIEPMEKNPESKDLNAFKISFTGDEPHLTQEVTSKLTMLFTQENLRLREEQSTGTTNFLEEHLQAAAADLKQQEDRVRDYKMRYMGELPDNQAGNLAILAGLQSQLQNTQANLTRAKEQQVYLQSIISQSRTLASEGVVLPGVVAADPNEITRANLTRLRNERADLLARYTDKYPDVVKVDEQIKQMEAMLESSAQAPELQKVGSSQTTSKSPKPIERNASIAQLEGQLEVNRLEIQNAAEEARQIQARIVEYQGRINQTPIREQQLTDLLRNYDLSKKNYDDLLSKKNQSELATSLERRQQGQQFRVIDPASLPMKPASPLRVKVSLGGIAAGLALGALLVFLLESQNHSLADDRDLSRLFSFPLMVGVPMLFSAAENRRRSRLAMVEWLVGSTLCLLVCATEFYVYRRG